ncbi:MAG: hypothetical protein HYR75_06980, partial [Gemmatimonadetes bacterium]|nr:hypothetical protein [Gemmatimonadota bacterium]
MQRKRVIEWSMLSMVPLLLALSCDLANIAGGGVPSTQYWTLQDVTGNLSSQPFTNVTVDKGGALSQLDSPWRFPVNANCTVTMPLSGNWNGTAVHITSTGGGCGVGYILTMDGTASGA